MTGRQGDRAAGWLGGRVAGRQGDRVVECHGDRQQGDQPGRAELQGGGLVQVLG